MTEFIAIICISVLLYIFLKTLSTILKMTLLIKPILLAFIKSDSVKQLVIDLLTAYVKRTDNKLDDKALEIVKEKLFS